MEFLICYKICHNSRMYELISLSFDICRYIPKMYDGILTLCTYRWHTFCVRSDLRHRLIDGVELTQKSLNILYLV